MRSIGIFGEINIFVKNIPRSSRKTTTTYAHFKFVYCSYYSLFGLFDCFVSGNYEACIIFVIWLTALDVVFHHSSLIDVIHIRIVHQCVVWRFCRKIQIKTMNDADSQLFCGINSVVLLDGSNECYSRRAVPRTSTS